MSKLKRFGRWMADPVKISRGNLIALWVAYALLVIPAIVKILAYL